MIWKAIIGLVAALAAASLPSLSDDETLRGLRLEHERLTKLRERLERGESIGLEEIAGDWQALPTTEEEVDRAQARLIEVEQRFLVSLERLHQEPPKPAESLAARNPAESPPDDSERAPAEAARTEPTPPLPEIGDPAASPDPERLADLLYETGRYAEALEVYRSIIDPSPEREPKILFWTARCLERLGQEDEAAELLQRLVNGYPGSSWTDQAAWTLEFLERERALRHSIAQREEDRR